MAGLTMAETLRRPLSRQMALMGTMAGLARRVGEGRGSTLGRIRTTMWARYLMTEDGG